MRAGYIGSYIGEFKEEDKIKDSNMRSSSEKKDWNKWKQLLTNWCMHTLEIMTLLLWRKRNNSSQMKELTNWGEETQITSERRQAKSLWKGATLGLWRPMPPIRPVKRWSGGVSQMATSNGCHAGKPRNSREFLGFHAVKGHPREDPHEAEIEAALSPWV